MSDPERPLRPSRASLGRVWAAGAWQRLAKANPVLEDVKNVIPPISLLLVVVSLTVTTCQNAAINAHNRAADRPWILATPIVNLVTAKESRMSFNLRFGMDNLGHSPAFSTWVAWDALGVLDGDPDTERKILARQRELCGYGQGKDDYASSILYPGKSAVYAHDELEPVIDDNDVISEGMERIEADTRADFNIKKDSKIKIDWNVSYWLVGCVNYRFAVGGTVHQSSFAYGIDVPNASDADLPLHSHSLSSHTAAAYREGSLIFRATSIGSFAN